MAYGKLKIDSIESSTRILNVDDLALTSDLQNAAGLELATQAEAEAGTDNTKAMSPLRTAQAIAALGGGGGASVTYATQAEAEAGTASDKAMSPLRTAQAVAAQAPVKSVAGKTGSVTLAKADVGLGNVDNTSDAAKPISAATQAALNAKADLVGGVIPNAQIPSIALTEYLGAAASEAELVALTGQKGDWAIRTDTGSTWVITTNDGSAIGDWVQLATPADAVTSVNGQTGAVILSATDVGAATAAQGALADAAFQADDLATQAEAEAGTAGDKLMTPATTAQAIAALAGGGSGAAIGDVTLTARALATPEWMPCNGASYSQAAYPALFAELGQQNTEPGDYVATTGTATMPGSGVTYLYSSVSNGTVTLAESGSSITGPTGKPALLRSTDQGQTFSFVELNLSIFPPAPAPSFKLLSYTYGSFWLLIRESGKYYLATSTDGLTWQLKNGGVDFSIGGLNNSQPVAATGNYAYGGVGPNGDYVISIVHYDQQGFYGDDPVFVFFVVCNPGTGAVTVYEAPTAPFANNNEPKYNLFYALSTPYNFVYGNGANNSSYRTSSAANLQNGMPNTPGFVSVPYYQSSKTLNLDEYFIAFANDGTTIRAYLYNKDLYQGAINYSFATAFAARPELAGYPAKDYYCSAIEQSGGKIRALLQSYQPGAPKVFVSSANGGLTWALDSVYSSTELFSPFYADGALIANTATMSSTSWARLAFVPSYDPATMFKAPLIASPSNSGVNYFIKAA